MHNFVNPKNMDSAEKILYLTLVIRSICEDNNIQKDLVIKDFIYLLKREGEDKNA